MKKIKLFSFSLGLYAGSCVIGHRSIWISKIGKKIRVFVMTRSMIVLQGHPPPADFPPFLLKKVSFQRKLWLSPISAQIFWNVFLNTIFRMWYPMTILWYTSLTSLRMWNPTTIPRRKYVLPYDNTLILPSRCGSLR